jgi:hypothetical protein
LPGLYSQTVPGSYPVFAKAFGPGMHSQFETITNVNVVPEPATLLMAFGAILAAIFCRHRRTPSAIPVRLQSTSDRRVPMRACRAVPQ